SLSLTGLAGGTTYHYQVTSVDAYGQTATSADGTFTIGSANFSLQVSAAADRSASSALQGQTVAGTIYVFTSPASGVTRVRFWLDNPQMSGTPRQTRGEGHTAVLRSRGKRVCHPPQDKKNTKRLPTITRPGDQDPRRPGC